MKICVIGTGYVGLVTGTCFAEMGNDVVCIDIDVEKINLLNHDVSPIFEPGLEEMIRRNRSEERLAFSTDIRNGIRNARIVFIAVGTPTLDDGTADLRYVNEVAKCIGSYIESYTVVVDKSTVPVGTSEAVHSLIKARQEELGKSVDFDVVSNPEFLKEGAAIEDFMRPDRVVIGSDSTKATEIMKELYLSFTKNGHPIVLMDVRSAELTKYASNCMLALRISFMNEIARLSEVTGADIMKIREGVGTDSRIGMPFLYAGLGYGGSCFPKDIRAMSKSFDEQGLDSRLFQIIDEINRIQRIEFLARIERHYSNRLNGLAGLEFAIWGLSFKPNTDDMREAPSITIIMELMKKGAILRAYDPQAMNEAKKIFGIRSETLSFSSRQYDPLQDADALLLITEWNCFKKPDFERIADMMRGKVVFDGRNIYDPAHMKSMGFTYYGIGR